MMGDFNFDNPLENKQNIENSSSINNLDIIEDAFFDIWPELNPDCTGYTMKKTS